MYSLKERYGASLEVRTKPILAAKRRRQLYPFFFYMGPVALSITSVLLIGLMAVLYLNQAGQAIAANQAIQDLRAQQAELQRQNQDVLNTIAHEQSPSYIAAEAKKLGLVPADPKNVQMLIIDRLQPVPTKSIARDLQP
ncbi:MAG TPA: septum formation initiator family protein [Ktedonobacteraceae bacterium]